MVAWLYNLDQKEYSIYIYNWSPYPPELRWLSSSGGCATMVVQLPNGTTRMATPKPFANWTRGNFKCLACWRRTLRSKHAQSTVTVLAIFATREHHISKKQSSLTYHIYMQTRILWSSFAILVCVVWHHHQENVSYVSVACSTCITLAPIDLILIWKIIYISCILYIVYF